MSRIFIGSRGAVHETAARQYVGQGGAVTETSGSSAVAIDCTVGDAVASGSTAALSKILACTVGNAVSAGSDALVSNSGASVINCSVGNAVADGAAAAFKKTIAGFVADAIAAGATASIAAKITTSVFMNNTESILVGETVHWSWFPAGRIGSLGGITPTEGTGTTGSDGRFASSITYTPGVMVAAVRVTGATDDYVFYEAFA